MSALVVSPRRRRLRLFLRLRRHNLTGWDTRLFLAALLRHVRGRIVLVWDRGTIHSRDHRVREFLRRHPRLSVESFPSYAPELNPAEFVWAKTDAWLANAAPWDLDHLDEMLRTAARHVRHSQSLLWSCIHGSDLPWRR